MNRRVLKKKFYQEVIYNPSSGVRNSKFRIVLRFSSLCLKVVGGALLTVVLVPISLFRPIEIWQMNTRLSKISFFIEDLETGLRDLQSRNQAGRVWIIALYPINYPNRQLAKMYRRHMLILGKKQRWIAESTRFVWPIFGVVKKSVKDRSQKKFILWNAGQPTLKFNNNEIRRGTDLDRNLDFGKSQPYVCFAIPSKKYREIVDYGQTKMLSEKRDDLLTTIPELSSYLPVIQHLISNEIAVVRMGILEEERLPDNLGPLVIDYAVDFRSEFGDIWLHSKCLFSLVAGTGSHWFGAVFNRPTVLTDSYTIRSTYNFKDLFIPQCGWLPNEGRNLTFSEIMHTEFARDSKILKSGVEIVKNTPNEIIEVTTEMILRLAGKWVETDEDRELQARYRRIVDSFNYHQRTPARMGAKFLREHQHLLPQ